MKKKIKQEECHHNYFLSCWLFLFVLVIILKQNQFDLLTEFWSLGRV